MFSWIAVAWIVGLCSSTALQLNDNSNKNAIVGQVRNLSVQVVSLEDAGIVGTENVSEASSHGQDNAIIKLNVSWLPPEIGRKPSFYSVSITSVQLNGTIDINSTSTSCPDGSIYYVGQDREETHILLPENRFDDGEAGIELSIQPECAYRVQVFANPRSSSSNVDAAPWTIIRVPECVGSRCSCERALETLPIPLVVYRNLGNGSSHISWKIEMDEIRQAQIYAYEISIGEPHLTSSSGLLVYNKTRIFTAGANDKSFMWNQEKLKKGTKIFVAAQDSYGCSGREGTYTTKRQRHLSFYRRNVTVIIFTGLVTLCLMISGIYSFIKYLSRNHNYKLISLGQKSTRQITSVLHNPRIEALLRNHNILYVEHDIEEARRKELADEHEIPYNRLKIERELGQGQFGRVYLARLLGSDSSGPNDRFVAVKMSSPTGSVQIESRQQLLEEIAMTKAAGSHPHLVGLIGCCTLPTNPVCLVLEYMRGGDLLGYLHRLREKTRDSSPIASIDSPGLTSVAETMCTTLSSPSPTTPTSRVFFANDIKPEDITYLDVPSTEATVISHAEIMRFALEIARGMEHLEAKGIVHRDLAARNVLMDENLVLKISDFGLSREGVYTLNGPGARRLPIRWMSPEAISQRSFTSKSDVWSYGLVLWEIANLGDFPYARLTDDALLRYLLEDNGHPELGSAAMALIPSEMKDVMEACWASEPDRRPDFARIVLWLESCGRSDCKNNPAYRDVMSESS